MLEVGVWGKSGVNLQPMSLKVGEGWGLGGRGQERHRYTAYFTSV